MAGSRCGCSQDRCGCEIVAGPNVKVTGNGTKSNPIVIEALIPDYEPEEGGGTPVVTGGHITGEIIMFAGGSAPSGFLNCDGSAVSRTVYADLFAVCGVTYGAGNGSTTFNLPLLTERMPLGAGGTHPRGTKSGSFAATLTVANMPSHSHDNAHTHRIDHDHPATTTSSAGQHDHETGHNDVQGISSAVFRSGASASPYTTDNNLVAGAGAHTHTVDIPNHVGSSAGSSDTTTSVTGGGTPVNIEPRNTAVSFVIKT